MERILVVDDEQPVRDTLGLLLRQEGFRVVVAECGHTAVSAIEAFTFDVALVDIVMPGIDGIETIAILRQDAAGAFHHRDVGLCGRQRAGGAGLLPHRDGARRDLLPAQAVHARTAARRDRVLPPVALDGGVS